MKYTRYRLIIINILSLNSTTLAHIKKRDSQGYDDNVKHSN